MATLVPRSEFEQTLSRAHVEFRLAVFLFAVATKTAGFGQWMNLREKEISGLNVC